MLSNTGKGPKVAIKRFSYLTKYGGVEQLWLSENDYFIRAQYFNYDV